MKEILEDFQENLKNFRFRKKIYGRLFLIFIIAATLAISFLIFEMMTMHS